VTIKHRCTGAVLWAGERDCLRDELVAAVKSRANLSDANLSGANLSVANLSGANLSGANLSGADLSGANLSDANLSGANLSHTDLSGANLRGANLRGANLRGADLRGADLTGADLTGAYLTGANFARCSAVIPAGEPDGWTCVGWLNGDLLNVRVGCRNTGYASGVAYWTEKPDRQEVLAALVYVRAVAVLRGWNVD